MKRILLTITFMCVISASVFGACNPCGCSTGVASAYQDIEIYNWPESTSKTLELCCGERIPAESLRSAIFGANEPWAVDVDKYTQTDWYQDLSNCNCFTTDVITLQGDPVAMELVGSIDPCTSGAQQITVKFKNPAQSKVVPGPRTCVDRDNEGNCTSWICTDEVNYNVIEEKERTFTINVVTLPAGCNGSCAKAPEQCGENETYDAATCSCVRNPPTCTNSPCEPPCSTNACPNSCPNPPCEPPPCLNPPCPTPCSGPSCPPPNDGGDGGGGGSCPAGHHFVAGSGCVPNVEPPPPPETCKRGEAWDPELGKCVCADSQGRPVSDKPCCKDKTPCGSCEAGGSCSSGGKCPASSGLGLSGLHVNIPIGAGSYGARNPVLYISDFVPTTASATAANLQLDNASVTQEVLFENDNYRQILTSNRLVDIVTLSPSKIDVRQYEISNKGTKNSNGFYQPTGSPLQSTILENPLVGSSPDYNRIQVTKSETGAEPVIDEFYHSSYSGALRLGEGFSTSTGKFARVVFRQSRWISYNEEWVVTITVTDGDSNIASQKHNRYRLFPWGKELIEEVEETGLPGHSGYVSTWEYYTNPAETGKYSNLKQSVSIDGSWVKYDYDTSGTEIKRVEPFKDSPITASDNQAKVTETTSTIVDGIRTKLVVQSVLGNVVSRTYQITSDFATTDVVCLSPNALPDDASNLITTTDLFTTGPYKWKEKSVLRPDGTMSITQLSYDGSDLIVSKSTGEPNPAHSQIVDGSSEVSRINPAGVEVERAVFDIASGLQIDGSTVVQFDALGRPIRTEYLDGTWEEAIHTCCSGLKSQTDRGGLTTYYSQDVLGRNLSETKEGITRRYEYDAEGRQLSVTRVGSDNSEIVVETNSYDWSGDRKWTKDALNYTTTYEHPGFNPLVTRETHPDDGVVETSMWLDGTIKSIDGSAVHPSSNDYYSTVTNQLVHRSAVGTTCPMCANTEWVETYQDMAGRSVRTLYPDGAEEVSFYNAKGQLWKRVNADGVVKLAQYDDQGRLFRQAIDMNKNDIIDLNGTDRITETGRSVSVINSKTAVKEVTRQYQEDGSSIPFEVQARTLFPASSEQENHTIKYGLVTSTTQVVNSDGSQLITIFNPDGSRKTKLTSETRTLEEVILDSGMKQISKTSYTYDPHGRVYSSIDARNGATYFDYDAKDQLTTVTLPPATTSTVSQVNGYLYDSMGRKKEAILPDGSRQYNTYYLTGDLKSTSGSQTYQQDYMYDSQGRRLSLTTDGNRTTIWHYHASRGWLTFKEYADGQGPTYTYTLGGKLHTRTWQRGVSTTYTYNNAGELQNIDYSDSTPDITFDYNRRGDRKAIYDGIGARSLNYTNFGGLESEDLLGHHFNDTMTYITYDALHRRQSHEVLDESAGLDTYTSYEYDGVSRIKSVTGGTVTTRVDYAYEENSNLIKSITYNENYNTGIMQTERKYDNLNRLITQSTRRLTNNTLIAQYNYNLNELNQRTAMETEDGAYWNYAYDPLGQVTSGTKRLADATPIRGYDFGYTYDGTGNRTTATVNGRLQSYTSNDLNQYSQRTVPPDVDVAGRTDPTASVSVNGTSALRQGEYYHSLVNVDNSVSAQYTGITTNITSGTASTSNNSTVYTPATSENFIYDLDGNLLSDGRWQYTWDGENRLVGLETFTTVPALAKKRITYQYDYMSRRALKWIQDWNSSTNSWNSTDPIRCFYDGWNLVGEGGFKEVFGQYTWGLDLSGNLKGASGLGGLLLTAIQGWPRMVISDGNGNVSKLVPATALNLNVSANYEYGPFGETVHATGQDVDICPFRFAEKYADLESNLLYYGYRYYSVNVGRCLNRDPIQELGCINLYSLANNDFVNHSDVLGLLTDVDREVLLHAIKYARGHNLGPLGIFFPYLAPPITIESHRWGIQSSVEISNYIQNHALRLCICGVDSVYIDKKLLVETDHVWSIGRTIGMVKGDISKVRQVKNIIYWKFDGRVGPQHDSFDFDFQPGRHWSADILTLLGGFMDLPSFDILSTGTFGHTLSGLVDCNLLWGDSDRK